MGFAMVKPDRSGDTIKITALCRELGNPRLAVYINPGIFKNFYEKYRSNSVSNNQHQQRI